MKLLHKLSIAGLLCLSMFTFAAEQPVSVTANGTVQRVVEGSRILSIAHAPIAEWQWPQMTMNFEVAEGVELPPLEAGSEIEMVLTRRETGGQVITGVRLKDEAE